MKYKISKNIGFQVKNVEEAKLFYENVLGFKQPENSFVSELEFRTDYNSIFLIDGTENLGPVMEIVVDSGQRERSGIYSKACGMPS